MDYLENKKKFVEELSKVKRDGINDLIRYLTDRSDMFTAPASTRFHMSTLGGLAQHSLNTLDAFKSILHRNDNSTYSYYLCGEKIPIGGVTFTGEKVTDISEESVILIALLHDFCKTNFYVQEERNRKNKETKQWESYYAYTINDKHPYGHGEKSVMMIENFIKLNAYEKYAIRWHMGFPDGPDKNTFGQAVELYPIIWLFHSADLMASHFMEGNDNNLQPF